MRFSSTLILGCCALALPVIAAAETSVTNVTDVQTSVSQSVHITTDNGGTHVYTNMQESDNDAMRPFGAVMHSDYNLHLSTRLQCRQLLGEERATCVRETRRTENDSPSAVQVETREVGGFAETMTSEGAGNVWIGMCESALGTGHTFCGTNGRLGRLLERRSSMADGRFEKLFQRVMARMQRRMKTGTG